MVFKGHLIHGSVLVNEYFSVVGIFTTQVCLQHSFMWKQIHIEHFGIKKSKCTFSQYFNGPLHQKMSFNFLIPKHKKKRLYENTK